MCLVGEGAGVAGLISLIGVIGLLNLIRLNLFSLLSLMSLVLGHVATHLICADTRSIRDLSPWMWTASFATDYCISEHVIDDFPSRVIAQ